MAAIPSVQQRSVRSASLRARAQAAHSADWVLILVVAALVLLGLVMTYSTTFFWSYVADQALFTRMARHVLGAAIGIVAFAVLSRLDYAILRRLSLPIMGVCLGLLILVALAGDVEFNARRTLFDGSLQPSEIAKIAILVYAATWLASRRDQVQSISDGLMPFGVIVGIGVGFILLQPDLSTSLVIVLAAAAMFFVAGASLPQIVLVFAVAGGVFFVMINVYQHATDRMADWLAAIKDPAQYAHYHIKQALIAFADGGLFGRGIGASYQKNGSLPTPHTDSIFAVLAEEMGMFGVVITLALFAVLAYRALKIARNADTAFGAFLATGIITWIMGQALLNMLAMMSLLPLPGVPVPFLSLGGSSMIAVLAACGILVSISRGSRLDMTDEALLDEDIGGRSNYRANSIVRRRNSRTRAAGSGRAQAPEGDGDADIIGRDVSFDARLGTGGRAGANPPAWRFGRGSGSFVRRRRGRHGTGTGPSRWR
jgi:cell division protein FtsW